MEFPIVKLKNNVLQVDVDKRIYCEQAITFACYKFTNDCYIHQSISDKDSNIITVTFESKESQILDDTIAKLFCNELIDQQIRVTTEEKFGHIRDLIVEEAFRPVNDE